MKKLLLTTTAILSLSACSYWVKPGVSIQETAGALHECRMQGNQGGPKVFSAVQMEDTCMTAKGYKLSYIPPKE
jgi:hypothetical protein